MTHQEKLNLMFGDLGQRGIKKGTMAPPLYRLLWKMGVLITPPHFASFGANALLMGSWFAIFWELFMWFIIWRNQNISPISASVTALCAGVFFGITLAAYDRWQARKHSLPKWKDYPRHSNKRSNQTLQRTAFAAVRQG